MILPIIFDQSGMKLLIFLPRMRNAKDWLGALGLLLLLIFCSVQGARIIANEPTDYPIGTTTGFGCSLRGAILNANADSAVDPLCPAGDGTDTVVLQSDFTILLDGRGENRGTVGDLDILGPLILQGEGHTIDGGFRDRLFDIIGIDDFPVRLENITLMQGLDNGFPGDVVMAGAIRSRRTIGLLELSNVEFRNNHVDLSSKFEFIQAAGAIWTEVVDSNLVTFVGNSIRGTIPPDSQVAAAIGLYDDQSTMTQTVLDSNWIEQTSNFHAGIAATGGIGVFGSAGLDFSGVAAANQGKNGGFMYVDHDTDLIRVLATGHFEENTADTGGLIDRRGGLVALSMNGYSIQKNTARLGGALYGERGRFFVEDFDQIAFNHAEEGGVVYGDASHCLLWNGQQITQNNATRGGAIWLEDAFLFIRNVEEISHNEAVEEGGLVYASGPHEQGIRIEDVSTLHSNTVTGENGRGGVVSAYSTNVALSNITTITNQYAARGGVIALQATAESTVYTASIEDVQSISGNIADNDGPAGAVIHTLYANARISSITGNITANRAENGDGALIYTLHGRAELRSSTATITNQFAFRGGIIALEGSGYGAILHYAGDIAHNDGFFEGGLLFCGGSATCEIRDVHGRIEDNECGSGCLIYSEGQAVLADIVGDIVNNEANADGGVLYATDAQVQNIDGVVTDNSAETGRGGVFYVTHSLRVEGVRRVEDNRAFLQGGVAYSEGEIIFDSICLLTNNLAEKGNGSVAWAQTQLTVNSSTLTNNPSPALVSATNLMDVEEKSALRASASLIGATGQAYVAEVFPTGGAGNYSYDWSTGETTKVASAIQSVTTEVMVRDASFCSVQVTVTVPPPRADAGPDQVVCPSNPITVGGRPAGSPGPTVSNAPLLYQWQPENLIVSNDESGNPTVILLSEEMNFTLTVTDPITGQSDVDTVLISSYPVNMQVPSTLQICEGETIMLGGSPTATSESNLTLVYVWSPSKALSDPTTPNPEAAPDSSTNYTLTVSSRECRGLKKEAHTYVSVLPASPVLAEARPVGWSASRPLCPGESLVLGGDMENEVPVTYQWSPTSGLDDPTVAHPVATPSQSTTYTLRVYSEGRCSSASSTVTVNVNSLQVDAGVDLLHGGSLGGTPTARGGEGPYSYEWTPSTGLNNPQWANPIASPGSSLAYTVTVTDATGCQVQSPPVNVIVRDPSTTGYLAWEFSDDEALTLLQALEEVQEVVTQLLAIPRLAVEVSRLDTVEGTEAVIYAVGLRMSSVNGRTGDQLARQFIRLFDCDPTFLPCMVAEEDSLRLAGWTFLQFVNPPSYIRSDSSEEEGPPSLPVPVPTTSPLPPVIQPPQNIPSTFPDGDDDEEQVIVVRNGSAGLNSSCILLVLLCLMSILCAV